MPHIIIGTAGHIDHGKTALVQALTGVDTDRLKEEKERGLTIDLGFAHWGKKATIIDVPGHERFIRNMVAGVSTIDLVLLVIAADDGVMPQTREHLDILKILQVQRGLVVLNKIDLVDNEWLALVTEDVKMLVKDSFLENADIIPVSAVTGDGIDLLTQKIDELAKEVKRNRDTGVFWMPVDRSFSMKGFGTVLTGSILSGSVGVGDSIEILPQKINTRVRGLQSGGHPIERLSAGDRAAINLQSVDKAASGRGSVVSLPNYFTGSLRMDAKLQLLKSAPRPVKTRARLRVHFGTTEVMARVAIFAKKQIDPGGNAYVQLILEQPATTRRLDPFVIRQYSPTITIGGGIILKTDAPRRKLSAPNTLVELKALEQRDPTEALESLLLNSRFNARNVTNLATELAVNLSVVGQLLQKLADAGKIVFLKKGGKKAVVHQLGLDDLITKTLNSLRDFHQKHPAKPGIRKAELLNLVTEKFDPRLMDEILSALKESAKLKEIDGYLSLHGHEITLPPALIALKAKISTLLYEREFAPPAPQEIARLFNSKETEINEVLTAMMVLNEVVRVEDGVFFHPRRVAEAQERLVQFLQKHEKIAIPQFKDLVSGASRKYAMPLINYFDQQRITVRDGDFRTLV